jgi:LacI family transcriptional regulator
LPQRATIADLARAAGVSVATVDRVLNRRLPVRADTAARVIEAADSIGYHAAGLLKQRLVELPRRSFGFLLQKRTEPFYQALAAGLTDATESAEFIRGRASIAFVDEVSPGAIAARLRDLAPRVDAVAMVAVDHPSVNEAVEWSVGLGKPVVTLLTDLTTPARAACVSVDRRRSGRTAAWAITRLARQPGKIGILIGSHRYLSQELSEIACRGYVREYAPAFQVLEPIVVLDDPRIAHEAVVDMLASNPDLVGIYSAGGGGDGVALAVREEKAGSRVVVVCNELTPTTRSALGDGSVDLVLGSPIAALARKAVEAMEGALLGRVTGGTQFLLPADLHISESI